MTILTLLRVVFGLWLTIYIISFLVEINTVKQGTDIFPTTSSPLVLPASMAGFAWAYVALVAAPRLRKSRQAIVDGKKREQYVTERDFSFQMFHNRLPVVEQLTLDEINKMFSDIDVIRADKVIRRIDVNDPCDLETLHDEQHKALQLIQVMYVSNKIVDHEILETIQQLHAEVNARVEAHATMAMFVLEEEKRILADLLENVRTGATQQ